jgi:hypothetical protein
MRPFPMTLSPLILLSGQSLSQEIQLFSVFHLLMSHPTSLRMVIAVITSTRSIWLRSVPLLRNNSARKSNCGLFPFFLWSRFFRAFCGIVPLGCDPLVAQDIARAVDRTPPSASDKTRIHSSLAQHEQQIVLPVALKTLRNFFFASLYPRIPIRR